MLENEELVLRNTFVNAQMGPLADFRGHMNDHSLRQAKIKWTDNGEDNKQKLRTNNSEDDLVIKMDLQTVGPQENHRTKQHSLGGASIKPFKQTLAEVTGVMGFDSIAHSSGGIPTPSQHHTQRKEDSKK